ncbi:hypothetical protein [Caproiciproducens galactitolivorans]|uniref:LemA family protein n=1 Tax=Caproiciproducens galactitolivorans TaxID=642589 RepID=A0ABT4BR78_9FIRM|nr:hypothetical protein [Caproiciproducens galactitolivorans]MCY1713382.1 hypothetical protein [Caproiciproducens galactitolivorans]
MRKATTTIKWISLISLIIILPLCLHIGDLIPVRDIRKGVMSLSNFFTGNVSFTFLLLLLLCFVFLAPDIYHSLQQDMEDIKTARQIKEEQKSGLKDLNQRCSEIESQLVSVQISIKDNKCDLREKCISHSISIRDQLAKLSNIQDNYLSHYHNGTKQLYHIASKTILYSQREIQSLIDQYQNIKF